MKGVCKVGNCTGHAPASSNVRGRPLKSSRIALLRLPGVPGNMMVVP